MNHDAEEKHYRLLVAKLDAERGWGLSVHEQQQYAQFLAARRKAKPNLGDTLLRMIATNYHNHHRDVRALQNPADPRHDLAWKDLSIAVGKFASSKIISLRYKDDGLCGPEDIAQLALIDIRRGLAKFNYESALNTWACTTVLYRIVNEYRRHRAKKRGEAQSDQSLDDTPEGRERAETSEIAQAEQIVLDQQLKELIIKVLKAQPEKRLEVIFRLSVFQEHTLREIGVHLSLSPARVLGLLKQAKSILRNEPAIREWLETGDGPHMSV